MFVKLAGFVDMKGDADYDVDVRAPLGRFDYDVESINDLIVQLPFEQQEMIEESPFHDTFKRAHGNAYVSWGIYLKVRATIETTDGQTHKYNVSIPMLRYNITPRTLDFVLRYLPREVKQFVDANDIRDELVRATLRLSKSS